MQIRLVTILLFYIWHFHEFTIAREISVLKLKSFYTLHSFSRLKKKLSSHILHTRYGLFYCPDKVSSLLCLFMINKNIYNDFELNRFIYKEQGSLCGEFTPPPQFKRTFIFKHLSQIILVVL